ncbi:hypothetical protein C0992_005235 [Termitomyces sp. T32_za158]|nr:hypothetical protein C0992_005235 [Termitomyces sp. T32_za158]
MDTDHVLPDPQLSSASRSSRSRRDSHSRKHHRDRDGARGSTKSKNPAHRSTRYKEKFQALRERYDRVLAIRDTIEHDLDIATQKMDKIQAENDLLLDAIHTASPELLDFVSPILAPRPLPAYSHAQPYLASTSHPHLHPPGPLYDPPPPAPQGRFSSAGPLNNQDTDYDYRYDYDYEMRASPRGVDRAQGQGSVGAVNGAKNSASALSSGGVNGNGILPSPGVEVCARWLC